MAIFINPQLSDRYELSDIQLYSEDKEELWTEIHDILLQRKEETVNTY